MTNGTVAETEVDAFVEQYGKEHSAGRGYTAKGKWRKSNADVNSVCKIWRCKYKDCPALLRATVCAVEPAPCLLARAVTPLPPPPLAIQLYNKIATFEKSTADGKRHNDHIENVNEVQGLPGHVRAILTPTKLKQKPRRIRACAAAS